MSLQRAIQAVEEGVQYSEICFGSYLSQEEQDRCSALIRTVSNLASQLPHLLQDRDLASFPTKVSQLSSKLEAPGHRNVFVSLLVRIANIFLTCLGYPLIASSTPDFKESLQRIRSALSSDSREFLLDLPKDVFPEESIGAMLNHFSLANLYVGALFLVYQDPTASTSFYERVKSNIEDLYEERGGDLEELELLEGLVLEALLNNHSLQFIYDEHSQSFSIDESLKIKSLLASNDLEYEIDDSKIEISTETASYLLACFRKEKQYISDIEGHCGFVFEKDDFDQYLLSNSSTGRTHQLFSLARDLEIFTTDSEYRHGVPLPSFSGDELGTIAQFYKDLDQFEKLCRQLYVALVPENKDREHPSRRMLMLREETKNLVKNWLQNIPRIEGEAEEEICITSMEVTSLYEADLSYKQFKHVSECLEIVHFVGNELNLNPKEVMELEARNELIKKYAQHKKETFLQKVAELGDEEILRSAEELCQEFDHVEEFGQTVKIETACWSTLLWEFASSSNDSSSEISASSSLDSFISAAEDVSMDAQAGSTIHPDYQHAISLSFSYLNRSTDELSLLELGIKREDLSRYIDSGDGSINYHALCVAIPYLAVGYCIENNNLAWRRQST